MKLIYFTLITLGLNFSYFRPKFEAEIDLYLQGKITYGYKLCWDKLIYPMPPEDLDWAHYVFIEVPVKNGFSIYSSVGVDIYKKIDTELFLLYIYKGFNFEIGYSIFDGGTFMIRYIKRF